MAPRGHPKQTSRGRYKQTTRVPVRSMNLSFAPLDTTPTSRGLRIGDDSRGTNVHEADPATSGFGNDIELVKPSNDEFFDDEGLGDSDMLAFEAQSSLQKPERKKSFAWSEADSFSRRSSPVPAGETPQANWHLDDVESIPNPYSSPASGTGNFPSTMPLQKDHLDALLPITGSAKEHRFDFSETASTARRSTPFDSIAAGDAAWELGESHPVTPHGDYVPGDASPSLSSAVQKAVCTGQSPDDSHEDITSLRQTKQIDSHYPEDRDTSESHQSNFTSLMEQPMVSKGHAAPRRKQRAKPPIQVDESTQRVKADPGVLMSVNGTVQKDAIVTTKAKTSLSRRRKPPTTSTNKAKQNVLKKPQPRNKRKVLEDTEHARPSKKPKNQDMDSSWEPSPVSRRLSRPRATAPKTNQPVNPSTGPAANTRARGAMVPKTSLLADAQHPPSAVLPPEDSPLSDPSSSQSGLGITSNGSNLSSPVGMDSTYFVDDTQAGLTGAEKVQASVRKHDGDYSNSKGRSESRPLTSGAVQKVSIVADASPMNCLEERSLPSQVAIAPAAVKPPAQQEVVHMGDRDEPASSIRGPRTTEVDAVSRFAKPRNPMLKTSGGPLGVAQSQVTIELSSDSVSSDSDNQETSLDAPLQTQRRSHLTHDGIQSGQLACSVVQPHSSVHDQPLTSLARNPTTISVTTGTPLLSLGSSRKLRSKHVRPSDIRDRKVPLLPLRETELNASRFIQSKTGHDNRIISVSVDGSPVVASKLVAERGKCEPVDLSPLDDEPIELVNAGHSAAGSEPITCSPPAQRPLQSKYNKERSKNQDTSWRPVDPFTELAGKFVKDVAKRLGDLATELRSTDKVYEVKMNRCLSKIQERESEEYLRLRDTNRRNVKRFLAMIEAGREIIKTQSSGRQKVYSELDRLWTLRGRAYDNTVSGLECLLQTLACERERL